MNNGTAIPNWPSVQTGVDNMICVFVVHVQLDCDVDLDSRPEFHRAVLDWSCLIDGVPLAKSTGNQLSSRLLSMHSANVLLKLPATSDQLHHLNKGELVDAIVISQL